MGETYKTLSHRAGCMRKKYKLTPLEAAWCVLWLEGAGEERIASLANQMVRIKAQRYEKATTHGKNLTSKST